MDKDFEKALKKMADESVIEVPEVLRMKVNNTCRNVKRRDDKMKKRMIAVASILVCTITAGVCFPTYAKEIPGVKEVIKLLSERFEINKYEDQQVKDDSNVTESMFTTKVEGYTIDIQEIHYDGSEFVMYYKIVGDEKLDQAKDYWIQLDLQSEVEGVTEISGGGFHQFVDDNTYIGMKSYSVVGKEEITKVSSKTAEVFSGKAVLNNLVINGTFNNLTGEVNYDALAKNAYDIIPIKNSEITLNLDAKDSVIKEYEINKTINEDNLAMHINKATEKTTGLIINRDREEFNPSLSGNYVIWDSKKGILKHMGIDPQDDGTLNFKYETPSKDGEIYIIPFVKGMKADTKDCYDRPLVKKGEKYDFGKFGTVEIKDFKVEGDKILITARTTGYQSLYGMYFVGEKIPGSFEALYSKDKKVNGMLDMEATYVFPNINEGKDFHFNVEKQDIDPTFEMKLDEAIKLK